jgi:hypothetical protein
MGTWTLQRTAVKLQQNHVGDTLVVGGAVRGS